MSTSSTSTSTSSTGTCGGRGGGGVEDEGKWRLAISGRVDSHQGEGWQELL